MTRLLAINTASTPCSVALCSDGALSVRHSTAERQAAQRVLPLVQELLEADGLSLETLDAIAVVNGPGSFTGMRIGVGVAQGLSLASDLPVITLSALAVIAKEAAMKSGAREFWLAALPARPPEIYLGAYRCTAGGDVLSLHGEWVGAPRNLAAGVAALGISEWGAAGAAWGRIDGLGGSLAVNPAECQSELLGAIHAVCELGLVHWRRRELVGADQVLPNYIREELDYS